MIFGGGGLQISIIQTAKEMGFESVVIDPNPNAEANTIADYFYVVAGNDYEYTLQLAQKHNISGVVTAATDHPISMMARIAKAMNLVFPSYESVELVLNKGKFKEFLKANSFRHAQGGVYHINTIPREDEIAFPVIIKPLRNSGSRGVIKCDSYDFLLKSVEETLRYSTIDEFIMEGYLEGDEISVEAFIYKNVLTLIQITDKIVTPPPYNVELGHIQPSKYTMDFKLSLHVLLQKVLTQAGLNNTAIHAELKIHDGKITIIEIGPRLGGDYITSRLVPLSTTVNMEKQVILIAIGDQPQYSIENKASMITYLNLPTNQMIKHLPNEQELKQKFPCIEEFTCDLMVNSMTWIVKNSLDRYGYFIISSDKREKLEIQSNSITHYISQYILSD